MPNPSGRPRETPLQQLDGLHINQSMLPQRVCHPSKLLDFPNAQAATAIRA